MEAPSLLKHTYPVMQAPQQQQQQPPPSQQPQQQPISPQFVASHPVRPPPSLFHGPLPPHNSNSSSNSNSNAFGLAPPSLLGQKRDALGAPVGQPSPTQGVPNAQEPGDGGNYVRLFVGSVPKTISEDEVRPIFEEHGNVLEVAILRDKRTGQQQDSAWPDPLEPTGAVVPA